MLGLLQRADMTTDLRAYLDLEDLLVGRLQSEWADEARTFQKQVEDAIAVEDWAAATAAAEEIDLSAVGERSKDFAYAVFKGAIDFGAQVAAGGPALVTSLGFDQSLRASVNQLLKYLEWQATAQAQESALQSIAQAQQTLVQKFNPYHDELGQFTYKEYATHVSITGMFAGRQNVDTYKARMRIQTNKFGPDAQDKHLEIIGALQTVVEDQLANPEYGYSESDAAYLRGDRAYAMDVFQNRVEEVLGFKIRDDRHPETGEYLYHATEFKLDTVAGQRKYARAALEMMAGASAVRDNQVSLRIVTERRDFVIGDMRGEYAGSYTPETGRIDLYSAHVKNETALLGILAHEVHHHKWTSVSQSSKGREFEEAWMDVRPEARDPKTFYHPAKADLASSDGVTDYSKDWWASAGRSTEVHHKAVNETLAEIATLSPSVRSKTVAPAWQDLFKLMNNLYDQQGRP